MEPPDDISSKATWYVSLGLAKKSRKEKSVRKKSRGSRKKFMVGMSV